MPRRSTTNPTNQIHQGPPAAVKTFTRNNNKAIQARKSRQASTLRVTTQPSCVALLKLAFGVLCVSLLLATPAQAARNHVFSNVKIGEKGSGAGDLELAAPVAYLGAGGSDEKGGSGVAVNDTTGDVYVADTGNRRVDEFTSAGVFVRAFGFGVATGANTLQTCTSSCRAGLSGENPGELETPLFIAVDNSPGGEGAVYVGDTGDDRVSKFRGDGSLIPGDDGVLDGEWGNGGPLGEANGQLAGPTATETFVAIDGLAVDTNGHLWIDSKHPGQIEEMFEFEQSGTFTGVSWRAEAEPSGVAVNDSEELYVADGHQDVEKFTASGEELGYLFPVPSVNFTGLAVDGVSGVLYLDQESEVDAVVGSCPPPAEGCVVQESFGAPQLTGGAGLAVDSESGAVYAANTTTDTVDAFDLEEPSLPSVPSDSVSEVTATSAIFSGEVDPESLSAEESAKLDQPAEPETKYHFEYGECPSPSECAASPYPSSTTAGELAPSFDTEGVSPAPVQGLTPGRTYHYRLIAENRAGEAEHKRGEGEERTFTTQAAGTFVLPDNRRWEMVSPVQKFGALIEPIAQEGIIQAAADGDAFTYHANAPIETEPAGAMNEVQVLSTRTPGGWSSHDIEPSHSSPTDKPEGEGEPYRFFSENLQLALVQPAGAFEPGLTPESSETTPLLRTDYLNGDVSEPCLPKSGMHCYRPLVTGCPSAQEEAGGKHCSQAVSEHADVPAGTQFGEARGERNGLCPYAQPFCGPQLEGASANGEHVVFRSYAQLTKTPAPGREGLYEWNAGVLQLVSILPREEGGVAETGISYLGTPHAYNTGGAISEDGSRVVWESEGKTYLRDTNPLSSSDPDAQTTSLVGEGEYQTASHEITRVFTTNSGGLDEYNVETGESKVIAEPAAEVHGTVSASGDGSYVYFVANGQIDSTASEGAIQGNCEAGGLPLTPGERCNLYAYHDRTTKLVAVLSGEDGADWSRGGSSRPELTVRVSSNGQYLAFMSDRNLTGYDPADATTGKPDEEVYLYDGETGHLACASCEPTGARPHGLDYYVGGSSENELSSPLISGDYANEIWDPSTSLAANIPGWTPNKLLVAAYQSRYLSNSGRLFFNSDDGLVPKDANNNWDVYEYEPQGVPSGEHACGAVSASGSDVFKPERTFANGSRTSQPAGTQETEPAGCVALISGGQSNEESAFLDASAGGGEGEDGEPGSEAGRDVFFLTTAKLAPQDSDSAFDVYDAHECTTQSPCIAPPASNPPACNTEASCKAPPTPQPGIYGPPPSATFNGPGNLTESPVVPTKVTKKTVKCKSGFVRRTVKPKHGKAKSECVRVKGKRKKGRK